jgi:hypothetical protein
VRDDIVGGAEGEGVVVGGHIGLDAKLLRLRGQGSVQKLLSIRTLLERKMDRNALVRSKTWTP